jgi:hypothetical protein
MCGSSPRMTGNRQSFQMIWTIADVSLSWGWKQMPLLCAG